LILEAFKIVLEAAKKGNIADVVAGITENKTFVKYRDQVNINPII